MASKLPPQLLLLLLISAILQKLSISEAQLRVPESSLFEQIPLAHILSSLSKCQLFVFPGWPNRALSAIYQSPVVFITKHVVISRSADHEPINNQTFGFRSGGQLMVVKHLRCNVNMALISIHPPNNVLTPLEALQLFNAAFYGSMFNGTELTTPNLRRMRNIRLHHHINLFFSSADSIPALSAISSLEHDIKLHHEPSKSRGEALYTLDALNTVFYFQRTYVIAGSPAGFSTFKIEFLQRSDPSAWHFFLAQMLKFDACAVAACNLHWRLNDDFDNGKLTVWNAHPRLPFMGHSVVEKLSEIIRSSDPIAEYEKLVQEDFSWKQHQFAAIIHWGSFLPLVNASEGHGRRFHPLSPAGFVSDPWLYPTGEPVDDFFAIVTNFDVYNAYESTNFFGILTDGQDSLTWLFTLLSILGVAAVVALVDFEVGCPLKNFVSHVATSLAALLDQWTFAPPKARFQNIWSKSVLISLSLAFGFMLILINNGYKSMIDANFITAQELWKSRLTNYKDVGNSSIRLLVVFNSYDHDCSHRCNTSTDLSRISNSGFEKPCSNEPIWTNLYYSSNYPRFIFSASQLASCANVRDGLNMDACDQSIEARGGLNLENVPGLQAFQNANYLCGDLALEDFLSSVYDSNGRGNEPDCPYCDQVREEPIAFFFPRSLLRSYWPLFLSWGHHEEDIRFVYTGDVEIKPGLLENTNLAAYVLCERAPLGQWMVRRLKSLTTSGIAGYLQKHLLSKYKPVLSKHIGDHHEDIVFGNDEKASQKQPQALSLNGGHVLVSLAIFGFGALVALLAFVVEITFTELLAAAYFSKF